MGHGPDFFYRGNCAQQARILDMAMFQYATDHEEHYPDGHSSTEVFQKLLDGGYITAPEVYVPLAGKIQPKTGQKTPRPENVSWDVTSGVDNTSPDTLPVVFMTGYKVTYSAGSPAIPVIVPYPRFGWLEPNPTWYEFFTQEAPTRWAKVPELALRTKAIRRSI